ncbi:MAG: zf-HC2 domain-containing protein [Pseudomonadota bacterium]|nr:zf-HC2 domain-containing protein [Pseudomonadota bacterium]
MNCRDICEILDNRNPGTLRAAERQQVEAHLDSCPECAHDWAAHQQLAALPDLEFPVALRANCRALATGARKGGTSHARRNRMAILGAFMAAAAAAVLLLWPGRNPMDSVAASVNRGHATGREGAFADAPEAGRVGRAGEISNPAGAGVTLRLVMPDDPAAATPESPRAVASGQLQRQMEAIRHDPANRRTLENFHTALLDELRAVQDLTVLDASAALPATASGENYQLKLDWVYVTQNDASIGGIENLLGVMLRAGRVLPDGKVMERMQEPVWISHQACEDGEKCTDASGAAADVVQKLRENVLPLDPAATGALQAKLQDASASPAHRLETFIDIVRTRGREDSAALFREPAAARAVLSLASAADQQQRAMVWQLLRGMAHAEFIEPMLVSALQDGDEARLQAIATLASDFGGDPRVRVLLERLSREESRPLLRAVAQRGLSGEETWKRYVQGSLQDASLTAPERIEALAYHVYPMRMPPGVTSPGQGRLQDVLDDDSVRALAGIIIEVDRLPGERGSLESLISNLGYGFSKNSAVTDMLLHCLKSHPSPKIRSIAAEVLSRTHREDARVQEALKKAMASDSSQRVRDRIREMTGGGQLY